jgi:hypothetical protein
MACLRKRDFAAITHSGVGEATQRYSHVRTETDTGVTWPQVRNTCSPWYLVRGDHETGISEDCRGLVNQVCPKPAGKHS